jgi:hypothetical protein
MTRKAALLSLLGLTLLPSPAWADGGAYGFFIAGSSLGDPSTPKQATTFTLYGASVLSLGASAYFLSEWQSTNQSRVDFNALEPNACAELTSEACAEASAFDRDANRSLNLGLGALSAGVTFALSGIMVAEYWPNSPMEPSVGFVPGGGFVATRLRF